MRAFNFSAGPAMLPEAVMRKAQAEFLDWHHTGMSVMEVSHRSPEFMDLAHHMEATLRSIMAIPDNYQVLLVHGGASLQFAGVPLNLTQAGDTADYVKTGVWSAKAIKEASRFVHVNIVAEAETTIPDFESWQLRADAKYLHFCSNETITGVEFQQEPEVSVPLVADMSSNILSRPIEVAKYGVIYAGAQKNIGPAGLGILIVREDLLGQARDSVPTLMNWQTYAENESMFNTPATYSWYLASLVFDWIQAEGGLAAMAEVNQRKAQRLYDMIDESALYHNKVDPRYRSRMNVTFTTGDEELDKQFIAEAKQAGLLSLKGHKLFGGMRASIYNAMPEAGVEALIEFMHQFERKRA